MAAACSSGAGSLGNQARPRVVGPCFRCAAWGHLAANCPAKDKLYPFCQSVVRETDKFKASVCDSVVCVNSILPCEVNAESADQGFKSLSEMCVNALKGEVLTGADCHQPSEQDPEDIDFSLSEEGEQGIIRFWELESQESGIQMTDVQGRLRKNLAFWKDVLHAPPPVLDCINQGYHLSLKILPHPHCQSNHKSTMISRQFVDEAINSLLLNRCVRKVDARPYICSPLSVVSNSSGKPRLVLNLRYLNQFLYVVSFKYEDLRVVALMFQEDEFLFKFDLKSGYHHVDIYPEHQKYLGFRWDNNDTVQYYVFTVLPFGLATACYLFTKLMRPLVRHWRGRGLKAIVYLDDGIIAVKGEQRASDESVRVRYELQCAGFVTHRKIPMDTIKKLGMVGLYCRPGKGEFSVPENKLDALKCQLQAISKAPGVPARQLASVIGRIMSMYLALGPVTRLMTRKLYFLLNQKTAWCQYLPLSLDAKQELAFWLERIAEFNGQNIWPKPSAMRVVYTDASDTGYGGYLVEHGNVVANGQWANDEAKQSSTWRELRAVRLVLECFQTLLKNE